MATTNIPKTSGAIDWRWRRSSNSVAARPRDVWLLLCVALLSRSAVAQSSPDEIVPVFDEALVEWDRLLTDGTVRNGLTLFKEGQLIENTVELPAQPANQRDARRVMATLIVEPVIVEEGDKLRPGDPWTRLGCLSVANRTDDGRVREIEVMRFITGFGGQSTYTQDITSLAPLLQGATTLRLFISTYKKPAWKVTLTITYINENVGYRRPIWAAPVFFEESINTEKSKAHAAIEVPSGLARPRLRIITSGHATDGTGGDEFVTRTHILRIDGVEIARWRPWAENAAELRAANPMSGRMQIDGRPLWSSDLDRSGWRSGDVVHPLIIPVAELSPGKHTVELEIVGIRPKDQFGNHGYWRVSAIAVADEPWPEHPEPKQE